MLATSHSAKVSTFVIILLFSFNFLKHVLPLHLLLCVCFQTTHKSRNKPFQYLYLSLTLERRKVHQQELCLFLPCIKYSNRLPIWASCLVPCKLFTYMFSETQDLGLLFFIPRHHCFSLRDALVLSSRIPFAVMLIIFASYSIANKLTLQSTSASTFYLRVPFNSIHLLRFFYSTCQIISMHNIFKLNAEINSYGKQLIHVQKSF